jgi:cytochrome P450
LGGAPCEGDAELWDALTKIVEALAIFIETSTSVDSRRRCTVDLQAVAKNLGNERPELAGQAAEEVMRHSPASLSAIRITVEDVDLHGILVPAGTCLGRVHQ